MKQMTLLAAFLVLAVAVCAATMIQDDTEGAGSYTARVYIDDGTSVTELSGTGSDIPSILKNAVESNGHKIDIGSVRVNSVDGKTAPDGKAWTVQQWLPPRGWEVVNFRNTQTLVNGTSYCVCLSDATKDSSGIETTYSKPRFEPQATGYFFIKFIEDSERNPYVKSILTKEQREKGFWISGTGSNLAWAFENACKKYGLELDMSHGIKGNTTNPDFIGWLNSFLDLKDELMSGDTNNGNWKYWSQFVWDNGRWVYSQTSGHYDPNVNSYYALVRQITTKDNVTPNAGVTPSDVPISAIKNGCTVKFVDGDGKTVKTQNVPYFGNATAPASATKSPTTEFSYEFQGWDGNYSQVISNVTVKAKFAEIQNIRVTGISITDSKTSIPSGTTYQFKASVSPSGAAQKAVKWSVSNTSVATIGSDGIFKALKSGTVTVVATSVDGGFTDSVNVTVTDKTDKVWSVKITGVPSSMEVGKTATLKATIEPTGAKDKTVSWSSSDESIAKIDQTGKITAIKAGEAQITVTTQDGGHTDTVKLTVTPSSDSVWSVEIEGGNRNVTKDSSVKLVAKILPASAKDKTVTWSVADTSIATIDKNGELVGKKFGTTTVEVRTNDGGHTATIDIKVVPGPGQAAYVTVSDGDVVLEKDSSTKLTASVDPDAKKKAVKWYSDNEGIAKVDANGNVTAVSPGTARITVEVVDGGVTGSCEIRVYSMEDISHVSEDTAEVEKNVASSELDAKRMKALAENNASYTLKTDGLGSVSLPSDSLAKLSAEGTITISVKIRPTSDLRDVQRKVIGDRQAFEYLVNGSDVPDLGGKATVSIPYVLKDGENPEDLAVCYVDYKGNIERFACTYDAATNMVVFKTTHFSVYFVTAEKMDEPSTGGSNSLPFAAIGVVAVVLIIGIVAFMRRSV